MDIFDELVWRDLIRDISDETKVKKWFKTPNAGIYIGFDPSFKSLHLGNYQTVCVLKRLALAKKKVYAIAGGITGLIGDPKPSIERQMQEAKVINDNVKCISIQLQKYAKAQKVINNIDFYKNMSIASYLRDIGKLINVNYILEKEIISRRLEVGISYAEFSYTLLQGYDFLHLFETEKITCQAGGSDQWGNITTGLEMIRKVHGHNTPACCFSLQLLVKPDGTKFGKSESGAIFLDPEITSPYHMYQFLINQEDSMVETLMKRLTFLSPAKITAIITQHKQKPALRLAQKELAKQIVTDVHGAEWYERVSDISIKLFNDKTNELKPDDLYIALSGTNVTDIVNTKNGFLELLVACKVCDSKSSARKLIEQNSLSINGEKIIDVNYIVDPKKVGIVTNKKQRFSYIKKGKKDYYLINWK